MHPIVIRPSVTSYKRYLVVTLPFVLAITGVSALKQPHTLLFVPILLLCGIIGIVLYFRNTSIELQTDKIIIINLLRRKKTIPLADIKTAILAKAYDNGSTVPAAQLLCIGHDAKPLFRITGQLWLVEDMESVIARYPDMTHQVIEEVITPKALAEQARLRLRFAERHPYIFAALAVLLLIISVIAVVLVREL